MPVSKINNILVIDDSEDFRKLLINFFGKVCPSATIDAYDPADGKPSETFVWDKYNLIILDYDLGNGENGLEWLRIYKTSPTFPPTIMLTAHGTEETVINAFKYGAHDYLHKKGLTKARLIESINCALEKQETDVKKTDTQQLSVHIYNKEKFYHSLEHIKKNDIIVLIEIDKFQALRDENGMISADGIANFTSEKILKYITSSKNVGVVTRISDSSIAIFIHSYRGDDMGSIVCEQLCEIFNKAVYKDQKGKIDFSLSIASLMMTNDSAEVESILKQADIACRDARNIAGNSYVTYEIKNDDEIKADERLHTHIENVFSENRVKPHYQGQIKFSSTETEIDNIEYYQIRLKLIDLDGDTIEAREFMPVLTNKKMLIDMDKWVVKSCIQHIASVIKSEPENIGFMILLTEESLTDIKFLKWIESVFAEQKVSDMRNTLVFEISIDNYKKHQKPTAFLIKTLGQKYNILFALTQVKDSSDLGACLSQSKFDFVMFTPFNDGNNMTEKEIQTIVSVSKKSGALSVANKIEDNDSMMTAMACNLDYIRGYFLQPPQETFVETEVVAIEM